MKKQPDGLSRSVTYHCSSGPVMQRSDTVVDWLSSAQLSLQLSEDERRRLAYRAKLHYLQSRLTDFERKQQQQEQQQQHPSTSATGSTPDAAAESSSSSSGRITSSSASRAATAGGGAMKLTPSTHQLAQQERDREIQRRRRRGRAPPPDLTNGGGPLRGKSLAAATAAAAAAAAAAVGSGPSPPALSMTLSTTTEGEAAASPEAQQPQQQHRPRRPEVPPLPELVSRSAGFYKLGFPPGDRDAAAPPLDGRLDGQRASILQLHHPTSRPGKRAAGLAAGTSGRPDLNNNKGGNHGDALSSYLDGQARRLLRVTGPATAPQSQQPKQHQSPAVVAALRDYERTFLQPRNPVNSPEPLVDLADCAGPHNYY